MGNTLYIYFLFYLYFLAYILLCCENIKEVEEDVNIYIYIYIIFKNNIYGTGFERESSYRFAI
jgi:hypothetical protein